MKKIAFFLSMLMLLTISTNSVWGETYTLGWGNATSDDGSFTNFTATSGTVNNIVSFVTAKESSTTNPAYNSSSKELRLYYNANGNGGSITLTPAEGVTITGFLMLTSTTPSVKYSVDGGTATAVSANTTNKTYTVTDISASSSLKIQNVNTSKTQLRISKILITYSVASDVPQQPSLSLSKEVIDFGTVEKGDGVNSQSVVVTYANLTGAVSYSGLSGAFSATGTISSTGDQITITPNTSIVGEYSQTLTVQSSSDNKSATVTVTMNVVEPFDGLQLTFPDYNDKKVSSYSATWTATKNGQIWNIANFNNNNSGWELIKAGSKNEESVASITTQVTNPVESIIVTVAGVTAANVKSHKLYVADNANFTSAIEVESDPAAIVAGDITYTIPLANRANNQYYKLEYDLAQGSSNGFLQISKLAYAYGTAAPQKQSTGLAYEEANHLAKVGTQYDAPTLTNPNSLADITYASSDANVVAVNTSTGALTINAVGKAVITASRAEDDTYKAGSASYTIYVTAHAGTEADPYTVADARLAIDCGAGVSGVYATGIVSQIVTAYNEQYGNITYNFSTDGQTTSDQLQAFRGKAKDGKNFTSEDAVQVGDEVVVKGNLTKFNSTYEFAADNQLYSLTRNKEDAGLAYAVTEIEKNIDDAAFTNALTNPHSLAVTYSSSAKVVATIDENGEVTIVGMGTTTIKATFAGDAAYSAGEASYTLKVNDPSLTKVTFDATTDIATVNAEGITKSGINIQTTHTDGVNDQGTYIAYYQTFKSDKLVVTSTVGNIKRIEFVTTETKYAATGFEGVTDNAWAGDASSVELTASSNQVRMSSIIVYYKADNRADAGLSWSTDAIELTVGDAFTAPTLTNPNSIAENEISVESDNTTLATVNAGVVSLIESATGTATITAMFEGNENYKPASVSYTITVNAVGAVKNVVILAKYDDKWYALMNEQGSANNTLNALEVVYSESNGAILNLSAEEQAKIIWKRSISSNKATFKNGTNYITGSSNNTNLTLSANECEWTIDGEHYVIGARTILYNKTGYFKNYATSNVSGSDYSNYVVVLEDPQFLTQSVIRGDLTEGKWGTFCYNQDVEHPTGASFFTIAYVGMENGVPYKVFFDEIGEGESLQAGQPYVYIANDDAIKGVPSGDPVAEGSNDHGFIGVLSDFTFQVSDAASQNKYYVIYDNQIRLCDDGWFKLLAGRAYIDIKDPNLPTQGTAAPAPGRRRISLSNPEAPQTATSINAIESNGKTVKVMIGEQLFILRDGKLYDTTGLLVK